MTQGRMTYHRRRLRLHGLIARIDGTHAYRLTTDGVRIAFFCNRVYNRILRPGLGCAMPDAPPDHSEMQRLLNRLDDAIFQSVDRTTIAA